MIRYLTAIVALLLLSVRGYTQELRLDHASFSTSNSNGLELKLSDSCIPAGVVRFKKPELWIMEPLKLAGNGSNSTAQQRNHSQSNMPVVKPDTAIHFPILAVKPDNAFLYHLRVQQQPK